MTENNTNNTHTLATGADLTPAMFEDLRQRLNYHCKGQGVEEHCTADAIFQVHQRELIYGIDTDFTDKWVVTCEDREHFSPQEYWDDADEEERAALNAAAQEYADLDFLKLAEHAQWDVLGELEDHSVHGWAERWTYVNSHFTKEAADAFIKRKAHDYPKGLRVYVDAQTYCWEWNTIKAAIMDGRLGMVSESPATQDIATLRDMLQHWKPTSKISMVAKTGASQLLDRLLTKR